MRDLYTWLKFIHVLSITAWLGGFAAFAVLNGVARRQSNPASVATYLQYGEILGARLAGPGSGLALLSGIAMMVVGHLGLQLWLIWGIAAAALFIVVGVVFLRPILLRLREATTAGSTSTDVGPILARQRTVLWVNLIILVSALGAMVLKPT